MDPELVAPWAWARQRLNIPSDEDLGIEEVEDAKMEDAKKEEVPEQFELDPVARMAAAAYQLSEAVRKG
jgi:hypothetical protein